MGETIAFQAVYERGKLRPLVSLQLPENQRVRVVLESVGNTTTEDDEVDSELRALVGIDPPLCLSGERKELRRAIGRKLTHT